MRRMPRLSLTRVVIILAALVVGYLIFSTVGGTVLSERLNSEERQLQDELQELRLKQAKLLAIREFVQTEEFVEGVARRVLGLVRPGETLFVVSSSVAPVTTPVGEPLESRRTWWEELFGP